MHTPTLDCFMWVLNVLVLSQQVLCRLSYPPVFNAFFSKFRNDQTSSAEEFGMFFACCQIQHPGGGGLEESERKDSKTILCGGLFIFLAQKAKPHDSTNITKSGCNRTRKILTTGRWLFCQKSWQLTGQI